MFEHLAGKRGNRNKKCKDYSIYKMIPKIILEFELIVWRDWDGSISGKLFHDVDIQ